MRGLANARLKALRSTPLRRPSIPPERLLRAMLLQAFYGIRSERQLMERMEFDLLFRGFVGLGVDDAAWDHSSFSKNRDRLLAGEIAGKFLRAVLAQPRVKQLISSDHFSVDGALIEAWASTKSFRKIDGGDNDPDGPGRNAERGFHAEKRSNATHRSTTDPPARLYKKGGLPAKLCYMGHALMENRHGLAVDVGHRHGRAGGRASNAGRRPGRRRITLGADKGYDVTGFVGDLRARRVTPHIAIDGHLSSTGKPRETAVGARTTRHPGYAVSQRCRKRIEEVFGWIKSSAGLAKVKLRGRAKVDALGSAGDEPCYFNRTAHQGNRTPSRSVSALPQATLTARKRSARLVLAARSAWAKIRLRREGRIAGRRPGRRDDAPCWPSVPGPRPPLRHRGA